MMTILRNKDIEMNTVLFQARANRLIEDVLKAFQLDKRGTMDEFRLEKHLQEIL